MKLSKETLGELAKAVAVELRSSFLPEYLTCPDAARLLGVSDTFLRKNYSLLGGRFIPGKKGRALRFTRAGIDAAMIDPTVKARFRNV